MLLRRTGFDRGVRLWATGQEVTEERPGLAVQLVTVMNLGCCLGYQVNILSGNSPGCIMSEGLPGTTFSWGLATGYWTC
jgi:hypothetical protein